MDQAGAGGIYAGLIISIEPSIHDPFEQCGLVALDGVDRKLELHHDLIMLHDLQVGQRITVQLSQDEKGRPYIQRVIASDPFDDESDLSPDPAQQFASAQPHAAASAMPPQQEPQVTGPVPVDQYDVIMPVANDQGACTTSFLFSRKDVSWNAKEQGSPARIVTDLFALSLENEAGLAFGAASAVGLPYNFLHGPVTGRRRAVGLSCIGATPHTFPPNGFQGESLTLGLALGLLMVASATKVRRVIATGQVSDRAGERPISIRPIDRLDQKIQAVLAQCPTFPGKTLFLVPWQFKDGRSIPDGPQRRQQFQNHYQAEIVALAAKRIVLTPVATLDEAAIQVQARYVANGFYDWAIYALLTLSLLLTAVVSWHLVVEARRNAPMDLIFDGPDRLPRNGDETPYMRSKEANADLEKLVDVALPMLRKGGIPAANPSDFVYACVVVPDTETEPVKLHAIFVTDRRNVDVYPLSSQKTVDPGAVWCAFANSHQRTVDETQVMFVVAERAPFSNLDLSKQLSDEFGNRTSQTRQDGAILEVESYLNSRFPGRVRKTTPFISLATGTEGGDQ